MSPQEYIALFKANVGRNSEARMADKMFPSPGAN